MGRDSIVKPVNLRPVNLTKIFRHQTTFPGQRTLTTPRIAAAAKLLAVQLMLQSAKAPLEVSAVVVTDREQEQTPHTHSRHDA